MDSDRTRAARGRRRRDRRGRRATAWLACALWVGCALSSPTAADADSEPWLGIVIAERSAEAPADVPGVRVVSTVPGGPTFLAGVRGGDRLLEVESRPIDGGAALREAIARLVPGDRVALVVLRDSVRREVTLTVGDRSLDLVAPAPGGASASSGVPAVLDAGIRTLRIPPELRTFLGAPEGVGVLISAVDAGSPAAEAGLASGDVVVRVGAREISEPGDLYRELFALAPGRSVEWEIVRESARSTVLFRVPETAAVVPSARERLRVEPQTRAVGAADVRVKMLSEELRELERRNRELALELESCRSERD